MEEQTDVCSVFNFISFPYRRVSFCVFGRGQNIESWNLKFLRNRDSPCPDSEIPRFSWKQNEPRVLDLFSHVSAWFFHTPHSTHTHTHTHTLTLTLTSLPFLLPCLLYHAYAHPLATCHWWKHESVVRCNILLLFVATVKLWSRHPKWN